MPPLINKSVADKARNVEHADKLTPEDSYAWATVKTVIAGDFYDDPTWFGLGIRAGLGCVPVLGQILDLSDTAACVLLAYERGLDDPEVWLNVGIVFIGYVPGVGDLMRTVLKGLVCNRTVKGLGELLDLILGLVGGNQYKALKEVVFEGWDKHVGEAIEIAKKFLDKFDALLSELKGHLEKSRLGKSLVDEIDLFSAFITEFRGKVDDGIRGALKEPRDKLRKLFAEAEEVRVPASSKGTAKRVDGVAEANKSDGFVVKPEDRLVRQAAITEKTPREVYAELVEGKKKAVGHYDRDDPSWREEVTDSTPMVRVVSRAEMEKLVADGRVLNKRTEEVLGDPVAGHEGLKRKLFVKNEDGVLVMKKDLGPDQGGQGAFPMSAHGPADSGYAKDLLDPDAETFLIKFKEGVKKSTGGPGKAETEYMRPLWINIEDVECIGDVANNQWVRGSPSNPLTETSTKGKVPSSSREGIDAARKAKISDIDASSRRVDGNYRLLKNKISKIEDPQIRSELTVELKALGADKQRMDFAVDDYQRARHGGSRDVAAENATEKINVFEEKTKNLTDKVDALGQPKVPAGQLSTAGRAFKAKFGEEGTVAHRGIRLRKGDQIEKGWRNPDNDGQMVLLKSDELADPIDGAKRYAKQAPGAKRSDLRDDDDIVVMSFRIRAEHVLEDPYDTMEHIILKPDVDLTSLQEFKEARFVLKPTVLDDIPIVDRDYRTKTVKARTAQSHPKGADSPSEPNTTGEPVDLVSGAVLAEETDFSLPGPLPLTFKRNWSSTHATRLGPLGRGWSHSLDQSLLIEPDQTVLRVGGRSLYFMPLDFIGQWDYNRGARMTLTRRKKGYTVLGPDKVTYAFSDVNRFDGALALVGIVDRNGNRIDLKYDTYGLLVEVVDSAGRQLQFINNEDGYLTAVEAPDPERSRGVKRLVTYLYDDEPRLVGVDDALDNTFSYVYDEDEHLIVQHTDRNGVSFYWEYDTAFLWPRCTKTWGDGNVLYRELKYDRPHRITTVKDGGGNTWVYHGNTVGMVEREIDPLGNVTLRDYDEDGNLLSETNPNGETTRYEYDDEGRQVAEIDALGNRSEQYYSNDSLIATTDALGQSWKYEYDESGNLVAVQDPQGGRWRYRYDGCGLPVEVIDPAGHSMLFEWDAAGNPISSTDRAGALSRMAFDRWGRIVSREDAEGGVTRWSWDLAGRIVSQTDAADRTSTFRYDGEGNQIEAVGPLGDKVRHVFGALGEVLRVQAADGQVTHLKYDNELRLVAVKDARSKRWAFERDPLGRITSEQAFDGRRRSYRYDPTGRVTLERDARGQETRRSFDASGRLLDRTYADGRQERFEYDALGRMCAAENDAGRLSLHYDELGNVIEQTFNGETTKTRFDLCGNRTRRDSPFGNELRFAYDEERRLAAVHQGQDPLMYLDRNRLGRDVERRFVGGLRMTRDYLPTGELSATRTQRDEEVLGARDYHYDAGGRLTKVSDRAFGMMQFEHDLAGRLEQAIYPDRTVQRFVGDEAGNVPGLPAVPRDPGMPSRQTESDGWRLRWDDDGNLLEKLGRELHFTFEYDTAGRLAQVTRDVRVAASKYTKRRKADPQQRWITSFTYDALGRRVSKRSQKASGEEQQVDFLWDGDVPLGHRRVGAGGSEAIEYVFDDGFAPLAQLGSGKDCVLECDHLDTPRAAYDVAGEVVWQADYTAFGQIREERGERGLVPFRFQGQYADEESGLSYNRFRYYDPDLRMYTSADPLGLRAGLNEHNYVDDPLSYVDPYGLCPKKSAQLHSDAEKARDEVVAEQAKKRHPPATAVGAYSPSTGKATAGVSRGKGRGCAEDACAEALGNPADIQFTNAVRPRTGKPVPVCPNCEAKYGRGAFPDDAAYASDRSR